MLYSFIKILHLSTVSFSIVFFLIRRIWRFNNNSLVRKRWVRKTSQFNDTVLLAWGIFMAVSIQQYPFVHQWLTAKLVLLVIYILLGMVALHWVRCRALQVSAWLTAILVYAYMVGIALNRNPVWLIEMI